MKKNSAISKKSLNKISIKALSEKKKKKIYAAMKKFVAEYGETLKLLGRE